MRIRTTIDRILYITLASLMGLMVLNVLWQVASRYVVNSPSSFTDELARYLLIWVGLLGAGYVTGKKLHLAIDLLPSRTTGKKAKNLAIFINTIVALFAMFVMVWGGLKLVYITLTLKQNSAALGLPLGFVYSVLPLSGILIIYYSIDNLIVPPEPYLEQGKEMF